MTRPSVPLAVGDVLPPVSIDLTLQRLIMMSTANKDFAPTHIDDVAAIASGAPRAYADMISILALFERAALFYAGPQARLSRLGDVRLRAFTVHGEPAVVRGAVARISANEADFDLALSQRVGTNCATATATVAFHVGH